MRDTETDIPTTLPQRSEQPALSPHQQFDRNIRGMAGVDDLTHREVPHLPGLELKEREPGTQIEPGYNCQSVVDDQYGLIVHADVLNAGNDVGQFAAQIDQAQETLGRHCETACADAGYSSPADLETVLDQGVDVVVPIVRHSDFRDHFRFDAARNEYVCPEGHRLAYLTTHADHKSDIYAMRNASTCVSCPRFGNCTRSRQGRRVERPYSEAVRERLEQRNRQPSATLLMRRRKMRAEHPFGHIKHNLGMRTFLLRSRSGVRAEMALAATAFNLRRMMSLLGIAGLINQLRSQ